MTKRDTCLSCRKDGVVVFLEMPRVPALVNLLHASPEGARGCARGDIVLGYCPNCGFIGNLAFESSLFAYEDGYENPLQHSEVFREYLRRLAEDLVKRFDLRGKKIVEIGCGDGYFLRLLTDIGDCRGVGMDPSYPTSLPTRFERMEIIRDAYSEDYAGLDPDFVCLRHTLEHVEDPRILLDPLRKTLGERSDVGVYIEVPDASYTLRNRFVWDVIYEHPSYFTPFSIPNVVERSGFETTRVYDAYSGQYLCVEARPAVGSPPMRSDARSSDEARESRRLIDVFAASYRDTIASWKRRLEGLAAVGKKAVLWGAGSKGTTFLNVLEAPEVIAYVVDLNPNKQGRFVPGTGHAIAAPDRLRGAPADVVVVANPVYLREIERALVDMDLRPEVLPL